MVRSTNSGTSAFVDHLGRVLNDAYTAQETSEYYSASIDVIRSSPTFYATFGNLIVWIYVFGFGTIYALVYFRKRRR
jgi:apolipoprotein N-acyltransferase